MPVYLDKKTNRLFIQFQYKGESYKQRFPAKTKRSHAEAIELKWKNDLMFEERGIPTARTAVTFERFIKEYYGPHIDAHYSKDSLEKAIHICKVALPFFRGKQLRAIKPADIERFKVWRVNLPTIHGKPRRAATVARELAIISKIFSLAVRNDLCDTNPCFKIEKPQIDNIQDRILKREDEKKFFDNMHSEWARDVCTMALYSGLRQNDIMNLTRFECDLAGGWIRLTQGKTKWRVDVAINSVMRPILERRIMKHKTGPLFPSPKDGSVNGSVRHAMTRACDRAEIPQITIRDLRRTFAVRLEENKVDGITIARALGHRDMRSVHRYARSLEMIRQASDSLIQSAASVPAEQIKIAK
jgi:integrase